MTKLQKKVRLQVGKKKRRELKSWEKMKIFVKSAQVRLPFSFFQLV